MINVEKVTYHYGIRPVLRDVSIQIQSGEVVVLMGPNGMGKSTLVSVMAGVIPPLKGFVEIDGKRRRRTPDEELEIRKKVAYLPAEQWFPAGQTGREWMIAVGRLYQVDDERLMDHADRLLEIFELTKQADSAIASYSTGQKRKIALCCALISDAPVLLLDEPFSGGLDPTGLLAMKRIVQKHAEQKDRTIVIATPVPELVEELPARIALMREGRIVAFDTLEGLRKLCGCAGRLDAIYQQLVSPGSSETINNYFAKP
jgi:ABC-2 type transport system ATP-binding protein